MEEQKRENGTGGKRGELAESRKKRQRGKELVANGRQREEARGKKKRGRTNENRERSRKNRRGRRENIPCVGEAEEIATV